MGKYFSFIFPFFKMKGFLAVIDDFEDEHLSSLSSKHSQLLEENIENCVAHQ